MKQKNLPTFSVTGSLQELIEVEMILIMLGYDTPDEGWNNYSNSNPVMKTVLDHIVLREKSRLQYHAHEGRGVKTVFKATDIEGIINYVTNYKK